MFGSWTVLDPDVGRDAYRKRLALARCGGCGTEKVVLLGNLTGGNSGICKACSNRAKLLARLRAGARHGSETHGLSRHPLYATWAGMMSRCYDPSHDSYPRYGGRGIGVCDRWHDVRAFVADVEASIGPRPGGKTVPGRKTAGGWPAYSLDRVHPDDDYAPGRVRWATWPEQRANRA